MAKRHSKSKSINWTKTFFLSLFSIVIVAASTCTFLYFYHENDKTNPDSSDSSTKENNKNEHPSPQPSGDEDKVSQKQDDYTAGDDLKDEHDEKLEAQKPVEEHTDGRKIAKVMVNFASYQDQPNTSTESNTMGSIVAGGAVTNLHEGTAGSCTYIFTDPDGETYTTKQASLESFKDTPCSTATLPTQKEGNWKVVLKYESPSALGESRPFSFLVKFETR